MPIKTLKLTNIGPFEDISFEFDSQVNVFLGPNNSGKTTALIALGDIVVFPFNVPEKLLRKKRISEFNLSFKKTKSGKVKQYSGALPIEKGSKYWTKNRWDNFIKIIHDIGYSSFIPALRRGTDFRSPGPLAKEKKPGSGQDFTYEDYLRQLNLEDEEDEIYWRIPEGNRKKGKKLTKIEMLSLKEQIKRNSLFVSDHFVMEDSSILQEMISLDYDAYRENKPVKRNIINNIGQLVSEITEGFPIEFLRMEKDSKGFFPLFNAPDGEMALNVFSQGTQSIIQWVSCFLIGYAKYYNFPKKLENKPGLLIIDEIDAHLHPSWQRRVIPTLTENFPNLQIFCSTHSPLVVAGLKEGQVQLLNRDNKGKITVSRNKQDIAGWTADEILRTFMDVDDATDLETSENLSRLQELRQKKRLKPNEKKELEKLRKILKGNVSEFEIHDKLKSFL